MADGYFCLVQLYFCKKNIQRAFLLCVTFYDAQSMNF